MDLEQAEVYYEKQRKALADQHRYIAQGQLEVAGRMAILPDMISEERRARAILEAARGREVDWTPIRAEHDAARAEVEATLAEIRVAGRPWMQ